MAGCGNPAAGRDKEEPLDETPLAFIGVRSCELHAIEIQDRVFLGGRHVDHHDAARRAGAFLVAVNCFEPAGTCFCTSMGTGPRVESGYDIALTELLDGTSSVSPGRTGSSIRSTRASSRRTGWGTSCSTVSSPHCLCGTSRIGFAAASAGPGRT